MAYVRTGQERLNWFIPDDMRAAIDAEMESLQPGVLPIFDESTITRDTAFEMVKPIVKTLSVNYLGVVVHNRRRYTHTESGSDAVGLPNVGIALGAGMILDRLAPVESKHGDIWPIDEPYSSKAYEDVIPSPVTNPAYLKAMLSPDSGIGDPQEIVANLQLNWSRWIIQYSDSTASETQRQHLS